MELGVYESLLTEAIIRELHQDDDLLAQYGNVDDAEQPLAITRQLTPIIERSLRAAGTPENRVDTREEILAALRFASLRRTSSSMREGVAWCEAVNVDAFLITLKKSDRDYSPTTMYRDFALSPDLFHWASQSTTSSSSRTGQRYIRHRERGSYVLLFVREAKATRWAPPPMSFWGLPIMSAMKETGRWRLAGGYIGQCRLRSTWRRVLQSPNSALAQIHCGTKLISRRSLVL